MIEDKEKLQQKLPARDAAELAAFVSGLRGQDEALDREIEAFAARGDADEHHGAVERWIRELGEPSRFVGYNASFEVAGEVRTPIDEIEETLKRGHSWTALRLSTPPATTASSPPSPRPSATGAAPPTTSPSSPPSANATAANAASGAASKDEQIQLASAWARNSASPPLACRPRLRYSRFSMLDYDTFRVQRRDREPLVLWMLEALELSGCRILHHSEPDRAPFRITFETPMGERLGIVAYAFLANSKETKNRPLDEHRFQVKYGADDKRLHTIWQDPYELYTTLFVGINLEHDFFVAADPVIHSPTRFFISIEFKEQNAQEILDAGWTTWERAKQSRTGIDEPVEVLVGGRKEHFLRLIRFERAAKGLDPGHRQFLAEKMAEQPLVATLEVATEARRRIEQTVPHAVADEFQLTPDQILDLIDSAPRLKMAVRGWVAEAHLERLLQTVPGVEDCVRLEAEGAADIQLRFQGSRPLQIECKNVLRQRLADGTIRLDFQRTRASKDDPCTRFYAPTDFDLVAACLHSCTETWEFRYSLTTALDPHKKCPGKLSNLVRIDERWIGGAARALRAAANAA